MTSFALLLVWMLECAAPSMAASPDAGFGLRMPEEDVKAAASIIAKCGKDSACLERRMTELAEEARGHLRETLGSVSPEMERVLARGCAGDSASGKSFVATTLCQSDWINAMQEGSANLLSPGALSREKFPAFLRDSAKQSPEPWYLAAFRTACRGGNATYSCFRSRMSQLAKDSSAARAAMDQYLSRAFQAMKLSQALCAADKKGCEKRALQAAELQIAADDPQRPRYQPRQSRSEVVERSDASAGSPGAASAKATAKADKKPSKPVDPLQAQIAPTDPGWEVVGPAEQCPEFLKPYNCLSSGTTKAGDLTNIRNAPYFYASRERMCRERLNHLDGEAYERRSKGWIPAEKASAADSPACKVLIDELHQQDPVPLLTREQIDTARVSSDGKLHDSLMSLADVVSTQGLERDLGVYSFQQQAVGLLEVQANLKPEILTNASSAAYDAEVALLLGSASCLKPAEKADLQAELEAFRQTARAQAPDVATLAERKQALDSQWADGLAEAAKQAVAMDDADFALSQEWGRLRCDRAIMGENKQCAELVQNVKALRSKSAELMSRKPLLGEHTGAMVARRDCAPGERRFESAASAATGGLLKNDCERPQTRADRLAAAATSGARLAEARAAASKVHAEGLEQLRSICSKDGGLAEEGRHAGGVDAIGEGFLSCGDIGAFSDRCEDRRSYGWAMCRLHMKNQGERNTERYKSMFQNIAMASGGALAMAATFGGAGVAAGVLGLGMSGSSIYLRHQEITASQAAAQYAQRDFRNQWASFGQFSAAWERMGDAQRGAIAGDLFDTLTSALDVHSLGDALHTARLAGKAAAVDEILKQGKGAEAWRAAGELQTVEKELARAGKAGAQALDDAFYDVRMEVRPYGPRAMSLDPAELARLGNFERRVARLALDGVIDAKDAAKLRSEVAQALLSKGELSKLGDAELAELFHDLQARATFAGSKGMAREARFMDSVLEILQERYPGVSKETWGHVSREERLALLEGKLKPEELNLKVADQIAIHPSKPSLDAMQVAGEVRHDPETQRFLRENAEFKGITAEDNRKYLGEVKRSGVGSDERLNVVVENVVQGTLNDILDKTAVDAANNLRNKVLLRRIRENPVLSGKLLAKSYGWKGIAFMFSENSPEVRAALKEVYEATARECADALNATPLRRLFSEKDGIVAQPASWNLGGLGETADEANHYGRVARRRFRAGGSGVTPLQDASSNPAISENWLDAHKEMEQQLKSKLGNVKGIMVPVPGQPGRLTLSSDATGLLRKVKTEGGLNGYIAEVQKRFKNRFGISPDAETIIDLRDYAGVTDNFSPQIQQVERVTVDLSKAEHGVMSWDQVGAGADNTAELAREIGKTDAGKMAIRRARKAEGVVTHSMALRIDAIQDAVRDVLGEEAAKLVQTSGDDVLLPLPFPVSAEKRARIQLKVDENLAKHGISRDRLRATYQSPEFAAIERSGAVVTAEQVEKKLRASLEGPELERKIPYEKLKQMSMNIEIHPGSSGKPGRIDVLVNGGDHLDAPTLALIRDEARRHVPAGYELGEVIDSRAAAQGMGKPARVNRPPPTRPVHDGTFFYSGSELPFQVEETARRPAVQTSYDDEYPAVKKLERRPLSNQSVILDSNAANALENAKQGGRYVNGELQRLTEREYQIAHQVEAASKGDLRVPDGVVVEREHAHRRGVMPAGWDSARIGASGLVPGAARDSKTYQSVLRKLEEGAIGNGKGAMDRQIIADALMAQRENGSIPVLMTGDKNIYHGLQRLMGRSIAGAKDSAKEFIFTVTDSNGQQHSIRVIPISRN